MDVILMNEPNKEKDFEIMLTEYPDILKVEDLKKIFPKTGKNKIYNLLKEEKIHSKRIGRDYYVPKVSIIKYLMEK